MTRETGGGARRAPGNAADGGVSGPAGRRGPGLDPLRGIDASGFVRAMETCERIAAKDRSNLYLVSQFLLDRKRYEAFIAMYAVMRVVDDLVDDAPGAGRLTGPGRAALDAELAAWGSRIEAACAGAPGPGDLDAALAAAVRAFPVPAALWKNFLEAMRYDLSHDRFENPGTFLNYAEGATVAPTTIFVILLCSTQAGSSQSAESVERFVIERTGDGFDPIVCGRNLGVFAYIAHILRDVARDLRLGEEGRIYIPVSDIEAAGLSLEEFRTVVGAGVRDERWSRLVRSLGERARVFERAGADMASRRYPRMDADCRFILALIIRTYRRLLDRILENPFSVLGGGSVPIGAGDTAVIAEAIAEAGYSPPGFDAIARGRGGH